MKKTIKLPLTHGYEALLCPKGFEKVKGLKFRAEIVGKRKRKYVYGRHSKNEGGKIKHTFLHRMLLGVSDPEVFVDHINGDTLDNRLSNLRAVTRRENVWNSSYRGTNYMARTGKWRARILTEGHRRHLGSFETEEEAHQAYRKAHREARKEFSRL